MQRFNLIRFFFTGLILILLSSCAFLFNGSPAEKIDHYLSWYAQRSLFSGAVLIARNGTVIIEKGYGYADRSTGIPFTPSTKTRLASVSKPFTAIAVMKLIENDQLSLDDLINPNFPETVSLPKVKIRHLLSMTSGLNDVISEMQEKNLLADTLDTWYPKTELDRIISDRTWTVNTPGIFMEYNNTNYYILARIVENITGSTLDQYLDTILFTPLSMTNTRDAGDASSDPPDTAVGHMATPYGLNCLKDVHLSYSLGCASILSTVHDLYLLDQALYTTSILTQSSLNDMFTIHTPLDGDARVIFNQNYGYGFSIDPTCRIGSRERKVIHHGGNFMGYSSFFARFPDERLTVIILCNIGEYTLRETVARDIAIMALE